MSFACKPLVAAWSYNLGLGPTDYSCCDEKGFKKKGDGWLTTGVKNAERKHFAERIVCSRVTIFCRVTCSTRKTHQGQKLLTFRVYGTASLRGRQSLVGAVVVLGHEGWGRSTLTRLENCGSMAMEVMPEVVLRRDTSSKLLWEIAEKFSTEGQCTGLAVHLLHGSGTDGYDFVQSRLGPGASYEKIALAILREWCRLKSWQAKGRDLYGVLNTIGMNDTADDFHLRLTRLTEGREDEIWSNPNLGHLGVKFLRGAWTDRDTNDIFAHCSLIFYFLDFKFSNFVCLSELHPLIWFFFKNFFRKKKNIQKTTQNALAPSIFIVLAIVLKLGTPLLHTQAQNTLLQNF